MKRYAIFLLISLLVAQACAPQTNADIFTQGSYATTSSSVEYADGITGYLAQPSEPGDYPAVIIVHEWWGLNDNIKQMADLLASHGYIVLAVDLYGSQVATTSEDARTLVGSIDQAKATANMQAAAQYVRDLGATKLGVLGWCFGGGQALQLALSGEQLDALVIYYGTLVTDDTLANITWPVLGIFGEEDASIPVETVNEFDAKLDELTIENEIYIYPSVGHAFANPSGMNYAPEQTKDAWGKTITFLEKHLK